MSRAKLFSALRTIYFAADRILAPLLGNRFRLLFMRLGYRLKGRLFPEYRGAIPASVSDLPQAESMWMPPGIPDWVIGEMKDIAISVDPTLFPTPPALAACQYYSFPVLPKAGQIYRHLLSGCSSSSYTHCYAIPWLKRGGADLVSLLHIKCAAELSMGRVLVIMTEPGDSPWLSQIPRNVDVIDASKVVGEISHEELLTVITRIFLQLDIQVLHILNSRHVWEVVSKHGLALRTRMKIYASVYCDDYDKYLRPVGYAREYLPKCYKHIEKVFSDNKTFPSFLRRCYGYSEDLFQSLRIPPIQKMKEKAARRAPSGERVLWAGRLDRQKRPDLLLAIAQKMPNVEFVVYGSPVVESDNKCINLLKKQKNVSMHGSYSRPEDLPFEEFPVFLYTSQWDGLPNIILEAAQAAIPVVASIVGGVSEVITEKTGFPVNDIESIDAYVTAIRMALDQQQMAQERANAAQKYVEREHTFENFCKALFSVPGYAESWRTKTVVHSLSKNLGAWQTSFGDLGR